MTISAIAEQLGVDVGGYNVSVGQYKGDWRVSSTGRTSSAQDRRLTGVAGLTWWPAIGRRPSIAIPLFDGDFTQDVAPGSASFTLRLETLSNGDIDAQTYRWAGAAVSLYAIDSDGEQDAAGSFDVADLDAVRIFKGRVESFSREGSGLTLTSAVDMEPFEKDVLALTYAGTGDAEGGADLKGRLKPWIFGRALNVEPVLVNSVDNVVQFSGYPIQGISALYERGASLGASIGNYATYAELVAATIPAGRWATCHTLGMARLGAPPYGVITGDIDGDNGGGFVRTTGAIIQRIATVCQIATELIDVDSFAALDAAVPYPINIVLTEQTSVLDLVRRLVRPCNAQAGVDFLGRMFAVRPQIGTPSLTLDAQGRRLPPVRKCTEADVSPPYKRIMFGANRSWRIHTFDEIAFDSPLVDRGEYQDGETYRRGNIVSLPNGSRWLYVSDTPKAGSLPAEGNADWESMTGAITAGNITYEDGTPVEDLKPAEPGATAGAPDDSPVGGTTAATVIAALLALGSVTDPDEIVAGALALIDRNQNHALALYDAQLLGQERKDRWERLLHLDGVEVATRVRQEITERIDGDTAIVEMVTEIEATATDGIAAAMAAISDEATVRASADTAETLERELALSLVQTRIDDEVLDLQAAILAEATTRADAISAETTQRESAISTLQADLDGQISTVEAAIASEATTRATADEAEATLREALAASVASDIADVNAAILSEATVRATDDAAEASAREALAATLTSDIADVSAAVETEATARAAEDGALASLLTAVQTTVDENTATALLLLESVDGLEARAGLRLTVGNKLTGWIANNDGEEGGFDFIADYVRFWSDDETESEAPFEFEDGVLRLKRAEVEQIRAGTGNSAQFNGFKASTPVVGTGMGNVHTVLSGTVTLLAPGRISADAGVAVSYSGTVTDSNLTLVIAGVGEFSVGGGTTEISFTLPGFSDELPAGNHLVEVNFEGPPEMTVEGRLCKTIIIYS